MYCPHCMAQNKDNNRICIKCGQSLIYVNDEHQLPVGSILSHRYYVGKALRQGGFGITYVGVDEKYGLNKKIAIKEFFPSGIASRMSRYSEDVSVTGKDQAFFYDKEKAKFLKEAQILAKFSNVRNIVSVTDIVSEHNTIYIIMEFLEGMDLDEYLHIHGRMSFDEAFVLLKQIMLSLGRIHAEGLIHRDISPSNIKILQDGTAVLLDFGAAREFDSNDERSMSIILKPGYAPPEQYGSRGQGKSTDVYALCATIYKMIPKCYTLIGEFYIERFYMKITIKGHHETENIYDEKANIDYTINKKHDDMDLNAILTSNEAKKNFLLGLVRIAKSDDVVEEREKNYYQLTASAIGLPEQGWRHPGQRDLRQGRQPELHWIDPLKKGIMRFTVVVSRQAARGKKYGESLPERNSCEGWHHTGTGRKD